MSELQLQAHPRFHLRFWRLQRLAWLGFVAILGAALLGLTGAGGPLAQTSTRTDGGRVDHPRVGRWSTGDEIQVVFTPGASGTRTLGMSRAFADHYQVEDIQPQPVRSVAGPGMSQLEFDAEPGAVAEVTLHVRALKPGLARYDLVLDGSVARVATLILP